MRKAMRAGLAHQYLMQALAMKRRNTKALKERVAAGKCLLCDRPYRSRGLCESHRQLFYQALAKQPDEAAKLEFEQEMIRNGHILAEGEQGEWKSNNPFLKSASA